MTPLALRRRAPARPRGPRRFLLTDAFLLVGALVMVFPFVWMILSAFKPASEIASPTPGLLPADPTLDNFRRLFELIPFATFFVNSVVITAVTVLGVLFTSSLLGYVLAQGRFRLAGAVFLLIVSSIAVPFEVKVVPLYRLMVQLGWDDSYQALVLPFLIDAFGVYLFREYIRNIPAEYFDAARLDGASEWQIYRRIVLPLTRPILATLAIFSFVFYWDQLLWPTIVISSEHLKTLPVGIALLSGERGARFDLAMAAGVLATVPPLIVFLLFQRHIERGVILAGMKG
jgi:multiple sugar transport system permease protein